MGRLINLWNKIRESRVVRFFKNPYLLATLFFLVWIFYIDENTILTWGSDILTVRDQEQQKLFYMEQIKRTEEEFNELNSNVDSLEKFAREQYFFHSPKEDVYIVK